MSISSNHFDIDKEYFSTEKIKKKKKKNYNNYLRVLAFILLVYIIIYFM